MDAAHREQRNRTLAEMKNRGVFVRPISLEEPGAQSPAQAADTSGAGGVGSPQPQRPPDAIQPIEPAVEQRRRRCACVCEVIVMLIAMGLWIACAVVGMTDAGTMTFSGKTLLLGSGKNSYTAQWYTPTNGTTELTAKFEMMPPSYDDYFYHEAVRAGSCKLNSKKVLQLGGILFWVSLAGFALFWPLVMTYDWVFHYDEEPLGSRRSWASQRSKSLVPWYSPPSRAFAVSSLFSLLGSIIYVSSIYEMKNNPTRECEGMKEVSLGAGPAWMLSYLVVCSVSWAVYIAYRCCFYGKDKQRSKPAAEGENEKEKEVFPHFPIPDQQHWDWGVSTGRLFTTLWGGFMLCTLTLWVVTIVYSANDVIRVEQRYLADDLVVRYNTYDFNQTVSFGAFSGKGVSAIVINGERKYLPIDPTNDVARTSYSCSGSECSSFNYIKTEPCIATSLVRTIDAGAIMFLSSFLFAYLVLFPLSLLLYWIVTGEAPVRKVFFVCGCTGWGLSLLAALVLVVGAAIFKATGFNGNDDVTCPPPTTVSLTYGPGFYLTLSYGVSGILVTMLYIFARHRCTRDVSAPETTNPDATLPSRAAVLDSQIELATQAIEEFNTIPDEQHEAAGAGEEETLGQREAPKKKRRRFKQSEGDEMSARKVPSHPTYQVATRELLPCEDEEEDERIKIVRQQRDAWLALQWQHTTQGLLPQ